MSAVNVVILVVLVALIVFRNSRPQKVTAGRFWISPAILVVLSALMLYSTVVAAPGSIGIAVVAIVIGAVLGVPLGIARGHHSVVRLTETPGVFFIDPSMIVMVIWLAAFVIRFGIRLVLPQAGPTALALSDGFLFFAISSVVASRFIIFRKYEALRAQAA